MTVRYTTTINAIPFHISAGAVVFFEVSSLLQLMFRLKNVKDYLGDIITDFQLLPILLANTFIYATGGVGGGGGNKSTPV